jgi:hypothetical protein
MQKDEIRERLIELIESAYFCPIEELADHLIANGVTVQRWIPVSERLPEEEEVLCYCENRYTTEIQVRYFSKNLKETSRDYFPRYDQERPGFFYSDLEYGLIEDTRVTHWMPLPEPPKGE